MRWRRLLLLVLAFLAACGVALVSVPRDRITLANYELIQPGMSVRQVKEVFGSPEEELPIAGAGPQWKTLRWRGSMLYVAVDFSGGVVKGKWVEVLREEPTLWEKVRKLWLW